MNISSTLGFIISGAVLWFGVIHPAANPLIFLDPHALILVLGGTLAAALIAFPLDRLIDLVLFLVYGILLKSKSKNQEIALDIIAAATQIDRPIPTVQSHPFLSEGIKLIQRGVLSAAELNVVLQKRSEYFKRTYVAEAKMLNALAKFPPAFGLLGASTGMITMMTSLGQGGQETIGPAMAIALVATFWGIAVANLLLLPMADYATKIAAEDATTRQLILEGLMMIKRGEGLEVIAEKLSSFLPPHQRRYVRELMNARFNVPYEESSISHRNSAQRSSHDDNDTKAS